jgi:hypothetical protein
VRPGGQAPGDEQPRIAHLTAQQEALLPGIREEWLAIGLSTEPADRARAEAGIRSAYLAAGLEPPRFVFWFGSPYAGAIASHVPPHIIGPRRDHVYAQVYDSVAAESGIGAYAAGARVMPGHDFQDSKQVDNLVHDQVGAQVHARVRDQAGDQVRAPRSVPRFTTGPPARSLPRSAARSSMRSLTINARV